MTRPLAGGFLDVGSRTNNAFRGQLAGVRQLMLGLGMREVAQVGV
jgi:hypothetical protein